ncbi:MAG: ABC transporter ATP-binding protein [Oscillibacter sp.]|nr:ABC transporter ATP-binding protein [Oscillibacter sp.]
MPVSKAQQKAVDKYVKANYDLYQVKMPKGRKAEIQAHAQARSESVNGFINRAIGETMERDKAASDSSEGQEMG